MVRPCKCSTIGAVAGKLLGADVTGLGADMLAVVETSGGAGTELVVDTELGGQAGG